MYFFKRKNRKLLPGIREIYFGIRIRYLLVLSVVMISIITVLALVMYLNQRSLLEDEKNTKANILTHILTGPSEFYLDKTIETTDQELNLKYDTITTESTNFKNFNGDIEKILLTDEKGRVMFSTDSGDYKRKNVFPYITNCLAQEEEKLAIYDYALLTPGGGGPGKGSQKTGAVQQQKSSQEIEPIEPSGPLMKLISISNIGRKNRFRAITYPIFLHKGNVIQLLKDFRKYYKQYHVAGPRDREKIYNDLWIKYWKTLGMEFEPKKTPKTNLLARKLEKSGDIDFLFLKLFGDIMILRDRRVNPDQRWMFRDRWLIDGKNQKMFYYINDMPEKAKEINDNIITTMESIAGHVEKIKKLGALAVIFNTDKIKSELDQTINRVLIIAAVMIVLGLVAYWFVLNFMIQNFKRLERWALTVSAGNLDSKIVIKTNDEIGRLSDIFNKMMDEITIKYHLEKFVSSSAKSMIGKKFVTSDRLELGGTDRRNLTFLFSDVRGFTSFSEKNPPEVVIEVLNFYLDLQANVIVSKKGDIDSYVGDEVMAVFRGINKIERAVETAIGIMKDVKKANAARLKEKKPIFEVGIGIHSGDVVSGNIGAHFRMNYTSIGDTVNIAARLCSNASPGEILVTRETIDLSKKKFTVSSVDPIGVKGKEKKIPIVTIKV